MTAVPAGAPAAPGEACGDGCCPSPVPWPTRDAGWLAAARRARALAWASLAWMCTEGAVGLWQGLGAGSVALAGWALGSVVEGLASVIVVWRFTGNRTVSATAERRAQQAVAASFWLLAPWVSIEAVRDLATGQHAAATVPGLVLVSASLLMMPALGYAKQRLGARLGSGATAREGSQNYLCAAQAAAVLASLALSAAWPRWWWAGPVTGLGIAAWAVREGTRSWRGQACC